MKMVRSLVCLLMVLSVSACNTLKGVGQDLQKVGEKLENAAKK